MKSKEGELDVLLSAPPPPPCGVDNCFSEKQDTSDDIVRLNEDTCAAAFSPKKCYLPIICLEVVVV